MAYDRDTIYRTSDGREFYNNQNKARKHQDYLDGITEEDLSLDSNLLAYGRLLKLYQAEERDWNKIVSFYEDNKSSLQYNSMQTPHAYQIYCIARAIINDDYMLAFETGKWGRETHDPYGYYKTAMEVGRKAWEKQNGREITDADLNQLHIDSLEKLISEFVSEEGYLGKYRAHNAEKWEELTGRKMTKEDMIRIAGKPFKIKKSDSDSSSSSSATSYGEPFGVILSIIISAVIAFISGTFLANFLYKFIPLNPDVLSIGLVAAVFIICMITCRNHKGLKIVKLAVVLIGISAIGIIGAKATANKTPRAKTETTQTLAITQQADITQNVNFRKGPSTNDEVIRQLKKGDTVTLTGEVSGGWTQITHNNDTGWVSSEFLKVWGGGQTAAPQTAEPKKAAPQAAALTAFPSEFAGTWRRDNYSNTLTFNAKTLKSSSQSYTWNFVSESNNAYTIHSDTSGTANINIKLANNSMVISGDSGGGEDNWNGTWKKQ